MLNMIVLKPRLDGISLDQPFGTMLNMIVLKQRLNLCIITTSFGTMSNMIVLKPRNMLFIKIIVFHKILKTLLYE